MAAERPSPSSVPLVEHGGLPLEELARRGLRPDDVVDFSVSLHQLGPSPAALAAACSADLGRYPDPQSSALRRALAERHGVEERQVWVGNGASELLWLAAHCWLQPGDRALIIGPTYGEYRRAAALAGACVVEYRAPEARDFVPDLDAVAALVERERPRLTFLCNPNNPTGVYLDALVVERLARLAAPGLLLLDEAYVPFVQAPWDAARAFGLSVADGGASAPRQAIAWPGGVARDLGQEAADTTVRAGAPPAPRVLLLRSMTKDYGLAGLRLGYALGPASLIEQLQRAAQPWSVNAAAQAAGLAALADNAHLEAGRRLVREVGAYLRRELARLGLVLRPSAANFWLVRVPNAAWLRQRLLDEGIVVRDCASFGLPGYIRLGARPLDDCARLVTALGRLLPGAAPPREAD